MFADGGDCGKEERLWTFLCHICSHFTSSKVNKTYCVYILASRSRNLYTGVTNNLHRRVAEHREGRTVGFTSKYNICRLVHYEVFSDIRNAIAREKEIKAWRREKKVSLIQRDNPTWHDLAEEWFGIGRKLNASAAAPQNATNAEKADPSRRPKSGRVRDDKDYKSAGHET